MEQINCSACGELIPAHERADLLNSDIEDVECISCELKFRDSADIDNF